MKRILFYLLLLPGLAFSQTSTIKVPVSIWNNQANALITVPKEYADSPFKKYPTIIFGHGAGEAGKDINSLKKVGLPRRINEGWEPSAIDPTTGILEKFIVISVQHETWGYYPPDFLFAWNFITARYRIDDTRVYSTGLSAGGQVAMMWANWDSTYSKRVAAVAVASPSSLDTTSFKNLSLYAKYKIPLWIRVATNDNLGPFYTDALKIQKVIKDNGGEVFLQTHTQGHGGWEDLYNGVSKIAWNGKQLNVYEWFLTKRKTQVSPPPMTDYQICIGMASKIKKIFILMKDGTYREMDSTDMYVPQIQLITQ